jgi:hypothetical protein
VGAIARAVALSGVMAEHIPTTYVVHITVTSPREIGQAAAAAAAAGFTEIRWAALESGERRALNQDELGETVQIVAKATEARRVGRTS